MRDVITDHAYFEHCLKDEYNKGYADAKAEYAPKWTRVEDGLPEERHAVVVYCPEYNNTYIASLHWDSDEDGEWYCWYYYTQGASRKITEDVIAWMPIPKYEG